MKIKIYTFLIVFYFLISNLFAGQISINSARDIARKLYYEKTKTDFNNIIFSNEYAIKNGNTIVYYIFNLQNAKGFIIIAADDRVSPVLAYSTTSSYNPANMSPAFYTFTQSYKNQITNVIQNNIKSSSEINNLWSKYKQNEKDFINSVSYQVLGSSVAPLLGVIMWDQGLGWNNNCPADVDGPGGHVYAGCVATATSQVMKYYHHPAKGTGSFSYTSANYGVLSANFAASTYDWANMPDASYNNNISQLLYNVGVALKMDYTADGSGAYDQQVKQALANYFDYSPNISYIERADYTDQDWIITIKNELDNARPVIYGGQDTTYGGHCFVCDGYDASDFFHINWGWSGGGDGYFNLSSLCVGKYNFNSDQDAVINIYPSSKNVPVSNFKSDINSITSGNSVHFFDVSSSAPTSWNWYFPGGSPAYSNQQNPVIKYNTPGIYPVSLIASNSKGAGINTVKNGYISVYKQPNNTCIVTTVDTDNVFRLGITNFQLGNINNSSGGAIEDKGYKDFSGIASTTLNPGQTYPLSVIVGPYIKENVNVYIDYNNNGVFTDAGELVYTGTAFTNTITGSFTTPATPTFNTLLRMRVISDYYLNTIGPCISPEYGQAEDYGVYFPSSAKPVADFATSNTTVNAGDKICLIDLSSNSPTSWQWTITPATYTFINGTNANSQNPQLFFNAKGTYTITLQATNASGSGIKTINSYITVNQTAPIADFTTDKTVINTNASVSFSDLSSMAPSSWQWTISPSTITYLNGTNSNSQNPVVKFNNSGNYTITLQSSNSIGSNTITKTEFIHVMVNPSCSTTTVYINNDYGIGIQNVRLASLIWNSGDTRADSIIYGGKGYMDFSSYANTSLLPNTTYSATITVGYFYKEKIKVFIDYNNNGVFTNLGENIYSSPSPEFVHTFSFTTPSSPVTNTYLRMRVVSDYNSVPGSCGNLNYGQAEDYAVFFPAACTSPVVAVTDQTICSGASANLTATGANAYSWSTTATTNSMTVNPTITTTYKVTGTTNGCTGTATATVTVNSLPSIIVNSPGICSGGSATLTAAGGSTYSWSTSATTNPITVSPTTTSTYYVTGTDANSCKNTAQSVVTVASALTVTVNSPVICNGASTTLTATGATTYSWSTSATTNPITVSPTTTTTYKVTGTTSGCTGTATATVTVNSLPTITVNSPGICSGGSATLTAAGGSVYSWSTSQTVNQITVSPTSTSTYYVTGTDAKSCKNTAQSVVTVASSLTVTVNSPSICSGASASLTATGANVYSWSTTATTNSITVNPTITT
ncbi:MAG: C10 family peptidase, partial [Bacteroidota bacterium]|nr:C10 family peptidase [Bacteroidota bacterium]